MTTARENIVDLDVTRWYHCINKCVRGACLLGPDPLDKGELPAFDRKQWIDQRLQFLASKFAMAVGGFAVLDNHLHVLIRHDPQVADQWSAAEVIGRWMAIYPPQSIDLDNKKIVDQWIAHQTLDVTRVNTLRERLKNLGWFMKALKEPLARLANQCDGCRGTFWQGRFKSIAILDTEALLATNIYIDLNVFAAGLSDTPETSLHTSINQRVAHALDQQDGLERLQAARQGSVAGSRAAGDLELDLWLVPIEDRGTHSGVANPTDRAGMLETFSLGSYLDLVDYTSRLFREGKAVLSTAATEIFQRLGTSAEVWNVRLQKMLVSRELRGNFFAADSTKVREHSRRSGTRRANLSPQPAPSG